MNVFGNNEKTANDIFMTYNVPILEDTIITGKIPDNLFEKDKEIKELMKKNIGNRNATSNYYTTNTSDKDHVRQKYQTFHSIIVKDGLYKETTHLLKDIKNLVVVLILIDGRNMDLRKLLVLNQLW